MNEKLFENIDNMNKRKSLENELSEINLAIKYHETIVKYLKDTNDIEIKSKLAVHTRMLAELKAVKRDINIKKEQVKTALKDRGLNY